MSNQAPFMGVNGETSNSTANIKKEQIYPSYEGNQMASHLLRDAFMIHMNEDGSNPTGVSSFLQPMPIPLPSHLTESPPKQRHIYESPEARARRLARNAERMRERRSSETDVEYRIRREKMASANRQRRLEENDIERTMRHLKDAARQRLRRAMESPEQRATRLAKLAERSRISRMNETPEQRAERNRKCLESNKLRYQRKQQGLLLSTKSKRIDVPPSHPESGINTPIPTPIKMDHKKAQSVIQETISNGEHSMDTTSSTSFDNIYLSYQTLKGPPFPDLPPHVAPNQPKYYGHIQNFVPPQTSSLHYISPVQQQVQPNSVISPPNSTQVQPEHHLPVTHMNQTTNHTYPTPITYSSPTVHSHTMIQPEVTRGRPVKILPSNNYQAIAPSLQQEAVRQQTLNNLLEEQINIIMTSPKQGRGRPPLSTNDLDANREERLRKMRESRKEQLKSETPEQRAARLKDLSERARKRRINLLSGETDDERRERLKRQAEYARERRVQKNQSTIAYRESQQQAKDLYAKHHQ